MKIDPVAFRDRFLREYESSDFKSLRQLSIASGFSESHLHKIANGAYDNSVSGPGCFGLARASLTLGTTPDNLLGFKKPAPPELEGGPSVAKMFRCYFESGGRIEGFSEMINFCDVYGKPSNKRTHLKRVGPLSLLARTARTTDAEALQFEFEKSPPDLQSAIFEGQLRAWNAGALAEPHYMDRRMLSKPLHVRLPFIRVGCRVSTIQGDERLLIYCESIV